MNTQIRHARHIVAAVIGNALEWYDFIVFGFVSIVIARVFFPMSNQYAALLLTFATFGVGFLMRPVGALVLGVYADRAGRKAALQLVMLLMSVAVALIAFAPTYASLGIAAPILIVLARLLQGFATGGEFSSATSFLVESAPAHRRGLFGSLQMVGQGFGVLLGAVAGVVVTRALTPERLESWGWRLPFLFGLLIGPVGLYIRRNLQETDEFRALLVSSPRAVGALLRDRGLAVSFLLSVCGTSAAYVAMLYMPTYANTQLALPLTDAFTAQTLALAWMVLLIPLFGILSDRVGRRPILIGGTLGCLVFPYPLFAWVQAQPSFLRLFGLQAAMCTVVAVIFGPFSTVLAEQFPAEVRSTGTAIAYNLAVTLFGGFAPFIVTWLVRATGSPSAPAFYIMFGACAGIAGTLLLGSRTASDRGPSRSQAHCARTGASR